MTDRAIHATTEIRIETGISALVSMVADYFATAAEHRFERQCRAELAGLLGHDAWELRDMGVSHDDIRAAIHLPIDMSAGRYLELVRKQAAASR